MSTYVWCEDRGSGYRFWKELFGALYPEFSVESKGNNSKLRKAAERLEEDGNAYYILMDIVADNPDVVREATRLKKCVFGKKNVHIIKVHSFEFSLLSFEKLEQWVFAAEDALKAERANLLQARRLLVKLNSEATAEDLQAIRSLTADLHFDNSEQLAADLLYYITRNTGFATGKDSLGECFINNCCEWTARQPDDICGLDEERPSADNKKQQLVGFSLLKQAFEEAGLL